MARKLLIPLTVLVALAVAAVSFAAPARTVKVGDGTYTVTWEGTGSGVLGAQDAGDAAGCQSGIHECDDTLIEVTEPGSLTVKTSNSTSPQCTGGSVCDTDLQIFSSNAQGEVRTELMESAAPTPTSDETVTVRVPAPGFYIARIDYMICTSCTVPAEATLKPAVAPPGGAPVGDAPPSVAVGRPKSKRVRTFTGIASDDNGVAKVEVGIIRTAKKGKCRDLAANGRLKAHKGQCTQPGIWIQAKGTTKWSLKLKKPLKKGKYVVFARATDTAGQTQGGYGTTNRRAFSVKK